MSKGENIYVLGAGAIGFPLAAFLTAAGRPVLAVRTSRDDVPRGTTTVTVDGPSGRLRVPVETISLAGLDGLDGTIVITAKSYANAPLARALRERSATGPVVVMQNGLGVEQPFVEAGLSPVYRCVLYVTSQAASENAFTVRPVTASPVGVVEGEASGLAACVAALSTAELPFRTEDDIRTETWTKAIANAVFNSICPLLDVDNGVFARDEDAAELARALVRECVELTDRLGLRLETSDIMEKIRRISRASDGQLISTLQDLEAGRPTEIESLNLEIARIAASVQPPLDVPRTEVLGRLIALKSARRRRTT